MESEIIVPLERNCRTEEIVPFLECWLRPGARVSLLVPVPFDLWEWWEDHFVNTESVPVAVAAGRKISTKYTEEAQRRRAEKEVFSVRKALEKQGAEVRVDLYSGSWRRRVRERTQSAARAWVICPTRASCPPTTAGTRWLAAIAPLTRRAVRRRFLFVAS